MVILILLPLYPTGRVSHKLIGEDQRVEEASEHEQKLQISQHLCIVLNTGFRFSYLSHLENHYYPSFFKSLLVKASMSVKLSMDW